MKMRTIRSLSTFPSKSTSSSISMSFSLRSVGDRFCSTSSAFFSSSSDLRVPFLCSRLFSSPSRFSKSSSFSSHSIVNSFPFTFSSSSFPSSFFSTSSASFSSSSSSSSNPFGASTASSSSPLGSSIRSILSNQKSKGGVADSVPVERVPMSFVVHGQERSVSARVGDSLLKTAQSNLIDEIEGACEGTMCCSTCHMIFESSVYDALGEVTDDELDMLDKAAGVTKTSRLGCQIKVTATLKGAKIRVPEEFSNQMK